MKILNKYILITLLLFGCVVNASAQENNTLGTDPKTDVLPPEAMASHYDDLLTKWKDGLKYEDGCDCEEGKPVSYPDSVYIQRLYSLPTRMELVFNPLVKRFIEMYAGQRRKQVSYMLGEGNYFFPMFEDILDKEGLPLELKYLPVIESGLNPQARSYVGATGLWQFMAGTGKMYKLEINSLVDERRDPVKATKAAAKYLKDMYEIYGDWNLVIAAYNCGPGNVNKAIRRSGGDKDYWAIYPYLPRETRGYVPAFIAATYIMNYYDKHNICPAEGTHPVSLDTLHIEKNIHFKQIADVLNVDIKDIRKYNPQFSFDVIPGEYKSYTFNLPYNVIGDFIAQEDSIIGYRTKELLSHRKTAGVSVTTGGVAGGTNVVHRIKSGDTLSGIAKKYRVSVKQLKQWNNLKSDRLTIGRRLSIYKNVQTPAIKLTEPKQKKQDAVVATIIDTIPELKQIELDKDYSLSLSDEYLAKVTEDISDFPLIKMNENDDTARQLEETNKLIYHKVKTGESLPQIAERYNVSEDNILEWNKLTSKSVKSGQRLLVYLSQTDNAKDEANTQTKNMNNGLRNMF